MKVKLGDIFEIGSGGTPSKSHPEYYGGDIPWVKTGDLKSEYLYEVEDFITEEGLKNSSAKLYEPDTVLIAMYGATIGATSILKMDACTNQACAAFKKNNKVIPEYLYYFLKSQKVKFVKDGVGGAQPNISAGYLKKVEMELPSLDEQRAIVEVLDKTTNIMVMRNQEIASLDNLIKARFVELFSETYEEVSAEDVCSEIVDCPHSTPKYDESELIYPAIRTSEIQNGSISWNSMKYVGAIEYEKRIKRLKPVRGDIVYAREGTYGDCVILPDEHEFCLGQRTMLFRPNYKICTSAYLHAALRSDAVKKQADESNAGSTVPHVNVADAKKFHFPLPPLELQQQFTDFVIEVNKSKVAVQKALDETQLLFDSLMQEYFG